MVNRARRPRPSALPRFLLVAILVLAWLTTSAAEARPVAAASDPIVAAAGDIACDPSNSRFNAPQTPTGVADPVSGIREITVGTGGADHTTLVMLAANSVVTNTTTFGILKLTLHASSYSWNFLPAVGTFKDGGSAACNV